MRHNSSTTRIVQRLEDDNPSRLVESKIPSPDQWQRLELRLSAIAPEALRQSSGESLPLIFFFSFAATVLLPMIRSFFPTTAILLWGVIGAVVSFWLNWDNDKLTDRERLMHIAAPSGFAIALAIALKVSASYVTLAAIFALAMYAAHRYLARRVFEHYDYWIYTSVYFTEDERRARKPIEVMFNTSTFALVMLMFLVFSMLFALPIAFAMTLLTCVLLAPRDALTLERMRLAKRVLNCFVDYGKGEFRPGQWIPEHSANVRAAILVILIAPFFLFLNQLIVAHVSWQALMNDVRYFRWFWPGLSILLLPAAWTIPLLLLYAEPLKAIEEHERLRELVEVDKSRVPVQNIVGRLVNSQAQMTGPNREVILESQQVFVGVSPDV